MLKILTGATSDNRPKITVIAIIIIEVRREKMSKMHSFASFFIVISMPNIQIQINAVFFTPFMLIRMF